MRFFIIINICYKKHKKNSYFLQKISFLAAFSCKNQYFYFYYLSKHTCPALILAYTLTYFSAFLFYATCITICVIFSQQCLFLCSPKVVSSKKQIHLCHTPILASLVIEFASSLRICTKKEHTLWCTLFEWLREPDSNLAVHQSSLRSS